MNHQWDDLIIVAPFEYNEGCGVGGCQVPIPGTIGWIGRRGEKAYGDYITLGNEKNPHISLALVWAAVALLAEQADQTLAALIKEGN